MLHFSGFGSMAFTTGLQVNIKSSKTTQAPALVQWVMDLKLATWMWQAGLVWRRSLNQFVIPYFSTFTTCIYLHTKVKNSSFEIGSFFMRSEWYLWPIRSGKLISRALYVAEGKRKYYPPIFEKGRILWPSLRRLYFRKVVGVFLRSIF